MVSVCLQMRGHTIVNLICIQVDLEMIETNAICRRRTVIFYYMRIVV